MEHLGGAGLAACGLDLKSSFHALPFTGQYICRSAWLNPLSSLSHLWFEKGAQAAFAGVSRSDCCSQSSASSPGARVLGEVCWKTISDPGAWVPGALVPSSVRGGCKPSGSKGPCQAEHCDGRWVNGYWPRASPAPGSQSSRLSQSSGPLPNSLQLQLLAGSLCFRGLKIWLLTSVSSTRAGLFSFLDIHHSQVCNRQKLETTSMSNDRKQVRLFRVNPYHQILSRHS